MSEELAWRYTQELPFITGQPKKQKLHERKRFEINTKRINTLELGINEIKREIDIIKIVAKKQLSNYEAEFVKRGESIAPSVQRNSMLTQKKESAKAPEAFDQWFQKYWQKSNDREGKEKDNNVQN